MSMRSVTHARWYLPRVSARRTFVTPMRTFSIVLLAALSLEGCEQQCEFRERCDGNTREVCGAAEEVARIERYPCEAPSPVCVAIDDDAAQCVTDPPTTCDKETFMPACGGD